MSQVPAWSTVMPPRETTFAPFMAAMLRPRRPRWRRGSP